MMLNEFFKILITGTMIMLLPQCNPIQRPAYLMTEEQQTREPVASEQELKTENVLEPREFNLPKAEPAAPGEGLKSAFENGTSTETMEDYMTYVIYDVHEFWASLMHQGGYSPPFVDYSFPSAADAEKHATECGFPNKADAFFCPIDDQIVVTQEMAQQVWDGTLNGRDAVSTDLAVNDFSVALLLAHQYAHSLQADLGWLRREPLEERKANGPIVPLEATENNAYCLAGIWTSSSYHSDQLKTEDMVKAINGLIGSGDDKLGGTEPQGNAEERTEAFFAGYDSGLASVCDAYLLNAYGGS